MRFYTFLFALILTAVLAACTSDDATETPGAGAPSDPETSPTATTESDETPVGQVNLVNTQWTLESFETAGEITPVLGETPLTLNFEEEGQAGGDGGCNSFSAGYQLEAETIMFSEIVSTLRACADDDLTQQEAQYLAALETAESFTLAADTLTIFYDNGQSSLHFTASAIPNGSS
jgi:heat shock protein HslJ